MAQGMTTTDSILFAAAAALMFVVCGYLLIYNIFDISVMQEVRQYGLLRMIGASPRQIKNLVKRQAFWLTLIGLPIGLAGGFAADELFLCRAQIGGTGLDFTADLCHRLEILTANMTEMNIGGDAPRLYMTDEMFGQLCRLMVYEGLYYAAGAYLIGGAAAAVFVLTVLRNALNSPSMWFFSLRFTLALAVAAVYLLLASVIPVVALHCCNVIRGRWSSGWGLGYCHTLLSGKRGFHLIELP